MLQKLFGVGAIVSAVVVWFARELIKTAFFDRVLHMVVNPNVGLLLEYAPPAVLAALGIYLLARQQPSPVTNPPAGDRRYVLIAIEALPAVFVATSRMRIDVVRALTTSAEPEAFGLVLSGTRQAIASTLASDHIARIVGSGPAARTDQGNSVTTPARRRIVA